MESTQRPTLVKRLQQEWRWFKGQYRRSDQAIAITLVLAILTELRLLVRGEDERWFLKDHEDDPSLTVTVRAVLQSRKGWHKFGRLMTGGDYWYRKVLSHETELHPCDILRKPFHH